ncbi:MAG: hypothetical protein H7145_09700 [Akkermansiaceae bacterium]|nr:hypothetical protein [Armatimonadota bacterium]
MFYTTAYFLFAYLLVWGLSCITRRIIRALPGDRFNAHRRTVAWRTCLAVLLATPFLPYAAVALQTAIFLPSLRPDIRQAMRDTSWSDGNFIGCRILWITPNTCHVAVRHLCFEDGSVEDGQIEDVLILKKSPTGWRLHSWDTVWSDVGSAEGNTFPPTWDADEF